MIKLTACFQGHDEQVIDFVTCLKFLGTAIMREDLATAQQIKYRELLKMPRIGASPIQDGHKKEYMQNTGSLLMRIKNLTINQAENFARQEKFNVQMFTHRETSVMSIECYRCGGSTHLPETVKTNGIMGDKINSVGMLSIIENGHLQIALTLYGSTSANTPSACPTTLPKFVHQT